ncbi:MAG: hypothetical protein ACE5KU_01215 [Nitrososphaerales archaeon]
MPHLGSALVFVSFREALSLALLILIILFLIIWLARIRTKMARRSRE